MSQRSPRRSRRRKNTDTNLTEEIVQEAQVAEIEMSEEKVMPAAIQDEVMEAEDGQAACLDPSQGLVEAPGEVEQPVGVELAAEPNAQETEELPFASEEEEASASQPTEDQGGSPSKAAEDEEEDEEKEDHDKVSHDQAELEKLFDPEWAALIKRLPEFCDEGLVLEENEHKEGNTKKTYQVPMMPIAPCIQERWADVGKELADSTQVSPFRKLDDKRYWISGTDFKKFCQSSTVDREYCIQLEKELVQRGEAVFSGHPRRRPFVKKSSAIRNPLLQTCENGFKKCDESARMCIRASSHAAFMLSGLRNLLKKPAGDAATDIEQRDTDLLRLVEGLQGSVETVADAASRVVARATISRRNICMSQIQRRTEAETFDDFLTLPMDSKNLFHGEFYPTMQAHRKANPAAKRKLSHPPPDFDHASKRPALMAPPYRQGPGPNPGPNPGPTRPGFQPGFRGREQQRGFNSWGRGRGGYIREGYNTFGPGRGAPSHRGNRRW